MEGCTRVRVSGRVFSGLGEGAFYVSIYSRNLEAAIGYRPYPGTLNISIDDRRDVEKLVECLSRVKPIVVEPPRIEGARLGGVLLYRARLYRGVDYWDVYIVRPMITHYKYDVIEVISEDYLRGLLGLRDGDRVEVEIECCSTSSEAPRRASS